MWRRRGSQPTLPEMFAKQVGRSLHIAGGRGAEDLDVVALPVHLPAHL